MIEEPELTGNDMCLILSSELENLSTSTRLEYLTPSYAGSTVTILRVACTSLLA